MRLRALLLAAVLAVGVAFLARGAGPGAGPMSADPAAAAVRPPISARPAPPPPASTPNRDPFRYGDEQGTPASAPVRAPLPRGPAPLAVAAPAVRLVGFVRKAGQLRAALAIGGEVLVAGPGETAAGYAILSVDEEAGVRLREPAGSELLLPPPS